METETLPDATADATDAPRFSAGYAGPLEFFAGDGSNKILAASIGPAGTDTEILQFHSGLRAAADAAVMAARGEIHAAVATVDTTERDRLAASVEAVKDAIEVLKEAKAAAEKEAADAIRRGEDPVPHETVAGAKRDEMRTLKKRYQVLKPMLNQERERVAKAQNAVRAEAVKRVRDAAAVSARDVAAALGNLVGGRMAELYGPRAVLEQIQG